MSLKHCAPSAMPPPQAELFSREQVQPFLRKSPKTFEYSHPMAPKAAAIPQRTAVLAVRTTFTMKVDKNKMEMRSVELQNEPGVYCAPELGPSGKLLPRIYPEVLTIADAVQNGRRIALKHGDTRLLGRYVHGEYEWLTYDEVLERVDSISSGLVSIGIKPGQETLITIFTANCVEWMLAFLSCVYQNIVVVPVNRFLNDDGVAYIINQCEAETTFVKTCEDATRIGSLLAQCPKLKTFVIFDDIPPDFKRQDGVTYFSLSDVEQLGRKTSHPKNPAKGGDDVLSVCYTSGSTGTPKGTIVTHSMILWSVNCFLEVYKPVAIEGDEVLLSYLPLAHIFGLVAECICLTAGYKIGYFSGNIKNFTRDMQALRPTFLPAVPRVINAIYDRIQQQLQSVSPLKRFLFALAVKRKTAFMQRTGSFRHPVYDRYLFSKVQQIFGSHLRLVIIGGSASQPNVMTFMKAVLGCPVIEGYGQTESCSSTICQQCSDLSIGDVGGPVFCVQLKLVPVEEQNLKSGNVGEIFVRGPNVTPGYFRYSEPDTFDEDGWLRTGDIARRNPDGSFSIIDRKKEIFKLSQGEYVAPVKVESCYVLLDVISQIFVTGWPERSFCVAIVVPEEGALRQKLKKLQIPEGDDTLAELCIREEIVNAVLDEMDEQAKKSKLSGVERVHRIYLEPEPFTIENGLLTATFKIRRSVAAKHYRGQIQKLYAAVN